MIIKPNRRLMIDRRIYEPGIETKVPDTFSANRKYYDVVKTKSVSKDVKENTVKTTKTSDKNKNKSKK